MGIKGRMLHWIHDFLQDRTIQVKVGTAFSRPHHLENGTPQGSVLSPLLFIIMMNGMARPIKGVQLSMYADDIALWTTGSKLGDITSRMQKQLNETAKFLFANGFKLSSNKSQAVLFRRNRIDANVKLSIGNELLSLSNTATFLGIVLDERLTWSAHAQTVEQRCLKRLNALRAISGSSWGASRSSLLQVYRATIRSVLDYGCEAVDLGNERIKSVYEKIQAQALAICCGSMRGTSTASLQVECGDPPHDLRRQKLMAYHALRTIANNNEASNCYFLLDKNKNKTQARLHLMMKKKKQLTPLQTIEALIPRNFVEDFQKRANRERLDEIAPWRLKLPKFDKSNLSFGNDDPLRMLVAKERIEDLRGNLLCFTDASKTEDGKAGIGIYIPQKDLKLSIRTSSHSSISSKELAAIESCLLHVKESYQGEILNLVIFTDSLSSLLKLEESNNAYNDPDVYRILSTISELQEKGKEVTLVWVPAPVGIPGNEQADALAKAATTKDTTECCIPATIKDVKRIIDQNVLQQWQTRWEDKEEKHYKLVEKRVSVKSKFQCASRKKETLISKLRLGKCALNRHLFKMKRHADGKCQTCPQEDETVQHFLMECPAQSSLRRAIRDKINPLELSSMLAILLVWS